MVPTASASRVSGSRMPSQASAAIEVAARKAKIRCQLPTSRKAPPMLGASTGTMMKTTITKDMTSAIRRPP